MVIVVVVVVVGGSLSTGWVQSADTKLWLLLGTEQATDEPIITKSIPWLKFYLGLFREAILYLRLKYKVDKGCI